MVADCIGDVTRFVKFNHRAIMYDTENREICRMCKMLVSELTLSFFSLSLVCEGSSTGNILQALEEYLPVLLGLVKEG